MKAVSWRPWSIVPALAAGLWLPANPGCGGPAPVTQAPASTARVPTVDTDQSEDCVVERIVRGTSMMPRIPPGARVSVAFDHYDAHPIQRGDIVLCSVAGRPNPLIKQVRALPGDSLSLRPTETLSECHILINEAVLTNSQGRPYLLRGKARRMLDLYVRDYRGRIPDDSYLVLGDKVTGTDDSTAFGLIDRANILAKIVDIKR